MVRSTQTAAEWFSAMQTRRRVGAGHARAGRAAVAMQAKRTAQQSFQARIEGAEKSRARNRNFTVTEHTNLLAPLADALREDPAVVARLCPDISKPRQGGLHDLMRALELSRPVSGELQALNHALRRTRSLEQAAAGATDPTAALAYLQAADRVIQVDDFAP